MFVQLVLGNNDNTSSCSQINHMIQQLNNQCLMVPVLKTMVEDFRDYRSVDVTHCDRGGNHITFGRAPSLGGTPVAQIIDTDRVKKGFDAWRMAHWFSQLVWKPCGEKS